MLTLIAQSQDAAENGLIDVASYLATPAVAAATATMIVQGVKNSLKDHYVSLVATAIALAVLSLSWLIGTWSPDFSDPRSVALTVFAVVITVVGPSGLFEVLKSLLRFLGLAKPSQKLTPAVLLTLTVGASLWSGGCTAPATLGEQHLLRDRAELAEQQAALVEAIPHPPSAQNWSAVQGVMRAHADFFAELHRWSTGGAFPSE